MKTLCYLIPGTALALVGCIATPGSDSGGSSRVGSGETALAIGVVVNEGTDTDVAIMQYGIERVACFDGEHFDTLKRTARVTLADIQLPGGITAFENAPLDKGSSHPFADHFEVLPAGCYNVRTQPLTAQAQLSADCSAALANHVEVLDGLTTEIFMISQCKGAAVGALDSVVALNQPPDLGGLTYTPSKFITAGETVTICATASDPNSDPIAFTWAVTGALACDAPAVVSNVQIGNSVTECVRITPAASGSYWFEVRMYDLIHDETGAMVSVESWLSAHGYPNPSHDSLRFPLYAAPSK